MVADSIIWELERTDVTADHKRVTIFRELTYGICNHFGIGKEI